MRVTFVKHADVRICYGDDHLSFQCGARDETRVKNSYGAPSVQSQNNGGNHRQQHPVDYNQNSAYDGRQQSRIAEEQGPSMSARTNPEPFMSARVGLATVEEDDRETRVKKTWATHNRDKEVASNEIVGAFT